MSRPIKKEINMLVDYIKSKTYNNDEWIAVKHREVPKICDISQYYVPRIFEGVQKHPNIVFKKDMKARTYNKPLLFKYIDKDQKFDILLKNLHYDYINPEQIRSLYSKLNIKEYTDFVDYLNMINYLRFLEEEHDRLKIDKEHLSTVYLKPIDKINNMLDTLIDIGILKQDKDDLYSVKLPAKENNIVSLPTKDDELTTENTETSGTEKGTIDDLIDGLNNFSNIMVDFKKYIDAQLNELSDEAIVDPKKIKEQEEEINRVEQAMSKLIDENSMLKETNEDLKNKNKLLMVSLDKAEEDKDHFVMYVQQRLEIMIAEITNLLSNYIQIPAWQKDEGVNAKLQKNIINSITSAVDTILDYENDLK